MKTVVLKAVQAKELKLGDIVARSTGTITTLEFLPIHEIRLSADGRVLIVQKTKNGVMLMTDSIVWIMTDSK